MATISELRGIAKVGTNFIEYVPNSTFQSTINVNLLSPTAGDTGWVDLWDLPGAGGVHVQDFSIILQGNTTITAGAVILEGTANLGANINNLEYLTAVNVANFSSGVLNVTSNYLSTLKVSNLNAMRYVRLRISTAFTGTTTGARVLAFQGNLPVSVPTLTKTIVVSQPNLTILGGVASHSAAASGNPVPVGGVVRNSQDTTLTNNDAARMGMSTHGNLIVTPYNHPESYFSFVGQISAGGAIGPAAGVGLRYYITQITLSNNGAANGIPTIGDSGATVWQCVMNTNGSGLTMPIIASFPTPLRCGSNLALNIALGGVPLLNYSVSGFIAP